MPAEWLTVTFSGGVQPDDPSAGLLTQDNCVADARDLEFRDGAAFSRVGWTTQVPGLAYGNINYAQAFQLNVPGNTSGYTQTANSVFVISDTTPSVYLLSYSDVNIGAGLPLAGAGTIPTVRYRSNVAYVNGYWIMAGFATNMIKFPFGGPYSAVATTGGWLYLTGHKSRIVAAFKNPTAPSAIDGQAIGWSTAGNIDNWTGFGGNEAGTILADTHGTITGLINLRDILVILRAEGLVLGRPTGQATPAFYFENFDKDGGIGTPFPGTVAADKGVAYFVGNDDIYTFNLSEVKAIGGKARKTIIDLCKLYNVQGALVKDVGAQRQQYYILSTAGPSAITWLYNITQDTWQRWELGDCTAQGPFFFPKAEHLPANHRSFAYFRSGSVPNFVRMNPAVAVETSPYFTTRTFIVGSSYREYRVLRALLTVHLSAAGSIELTCYNKRREEEQTTEITVAVPLASVANKPHRLWFRFDPAPVGNFFSFKVVLPTGLDSIVYKLEVEVADSGRTEDYAS